MKNLLEKTESDDLNIENCLRTQMAYVNALKLINYTAAFNELHTLEDAGDQEHFKMFLNTLLNEGASQELMDFELSYVTDMLFLCQVINTKVFGDFLWRLWCEFKIELEDNQFEDAYKSFRKRQDKLYQQRNTSLPPEPLFGIVNIDTINFAYKMLKEYAHLYAKDTKTFIQQIPLVFNIMNNSFIELFKDREKMIIQPIIAEQNGQKQTLYYFSVPNFIVCTKGDYDLNLQQQLNSEELKRKQGQPDTVSEVAKDLEDKKLTGVKWIGLDSPSGRYVIGGASGTILSDLKFVASGNRYEYQCSVLTRDEDTGELIEGSEHEARLTAAIYELDISPKQKLTGKLGNYHAIDQKMIVCPAELVDPKQIDKRKKDVVIMEIDEPIQVAYYEEKDVLIINSRAGRQLEIIDCA